MGCGLSGLEGSAYAAAVGWMLFRSRLSFKYRPRNARAARPRGTPTPAPTAATVPLLLLDLLSMSGCEQFVG